MPADDATGDRGTANSVLVVDGDPSASDRIAGAMERVAGEATVERGVDAAFDHVLGERPDAVVSAQSLVDGTGTDLLGAVREESGVPFVLYAREGDEELASEAVADGVSEYVPVDPDSGEGSVDEAGVQRLVAAVDRAIESGPETFEPPYERMVAHNPVGICALRDGEVRYANERFGSLFAAEPSTMEGTTLLEWVADADRDRVAEVAEPALVGRDDDVRRLSFTGVRADGASVEVELHARSAPGDGVGVVATATDVSERRGREQQLTVLHETTREMMRTEDREAIADLAVDTAVDVLELFAVAVYLYDRDAGELRPAASASSVMEVPRGAGALAGRVDLAWDVFVKGEERLAEDLGTGEDDPTTVSIRSALAIPLGDHGVFVAGGTDREAFDETDRRFARTLATNTEVALDRADRESTVMERTERLREQNEQLDRLRRIDAVARDIGQLLVRATSREEIERAVCERLAEVRYWEFAWVGERRVTDPGIVPRTWAPTGRRSVGEGFLEAVNAAGDGAPFAGTPAERAIEERAPVVTGDVVASHDDEGWRTVTLDHGFRSAVSIPLEHDHREYGVLEVYGDRPEAFGEDEREVLTELADMIAYAVDAVERERAMFADAGPELEVQIGNPEDVIAELTTETGGRVALDGVVPGEDGTFLTYVEVSETGLATGELLDTVESLAGRSAEVRDVRPIDAERGRFELRLSGGELFENVASHGAVLREVTAEGGGYTLRIELPGTADVRGFVEAFGRAYPDLEVLAQRSTAEDGDDLRGGLTDRLTDRQREVLEVAYHSGFFEWPRESNGEEIAETLGVSPPTVHKHLRTAERKLMAAILGSREARPAPPQRVQSDD